MSDSLEIRPLAEGDEVSLLGTFEAAFGRGLSLDEWRWAYRQNPAGTQVQVALRAGEVVAQYAALPSRVWMDGQLRTFSQVVDSMVHPSERRGLGRRGTFVRTAEAFFEAHAMGGAGAGDVSLFYGWPVPANRRIGERLLGYERAGLQHALVRPVPSGLPGEHDPDSGDQGVEELTGFDEQAKWLWERCASEMAVGTVRDADWLLWRYRCHPRHNYLCLGARDGEGILRGLLVGRPAVREGRLLALVADWMVPSAEPEVAQRLLAAFERAASSWGTQAIALWMPPFSNWFSWLQECGFRVHPTPWHLVIRSFERRVDLRLLREGWWYQLGDSDLV